MYILTCGSTGICGVVSQVHKFFAVQCYMQIELSSAVLFANKNFLDHTICITHHKFIYKKQATGNRFSTGIRLYSEEIGTIEKPSSELG